MINQFIRINCFFFMALACAVGAFADESISLKAVLALAFQHNPEVIEARQNIKIQQSKYKQSRKLTNPEIEADVDKIQQDFTGDGEFESRLLEGELRISQPLELWGKRGLKVGIAKDEITQAEFGFIGTWLEVSKQIKEQYSETILAQKGIELAEENLNIARRLLDQVQVRFDSGKSRNHELARTKLEAANARNGLLKAENDFQIALGKLNILMGRRMNENIKLQDTLTPIVMKTTLENYSQLALSKRPDILNQEVEIKKKTKELSMAKRQKIPDVTVGVFANREDEMYNAGAGITFTLPIWTQFQGEVEAADLEKQTAEIHLDALKRSVELEVYEAFQSVNLAFQTIHNLEDSIKEANELLRIITIEYDEGEAPFLIYLEGIASYQKTKQEYFAALTDYSHKLADLEQSIGLTEEVTEEK
ncbi:MAG: TolC family protein [Candidatus Omnitrophica bacterium]|nr:TolC family protein [Candidatus Omnitrophota bacterium]